ncbi:MAG TPA: TonB-dependent receptor [Ignavibacteriaceae bacterium]|nr:TonB-dependent receptor [Ignavibacteriaceae bacterium]
MNLVKTIILCSFLLLLFAVTSNAQKKDSILYLIPIDQIDSIKYETDEVIVTGTRTNQKIIDIPYSVVRISPTQYKYDRKVSISDVLNAVPGVFMQSRYGNHDVRISIRGFGSRSNSGIRGVRILLDGIPESEPDGQTRIESIDFNSIGSIEIVKGNSSSLYTNAPGGVVNFINDINFSKSFITQFNDFGSSDLRRNGFKAGIRTENYGLLTTYTYHNYKGYRPHSEDYWHILNTAFETTPGDNINLQFLGYFATGLLRLPGSLTKAEFDANPFQAAQREMDWDFRRVSKKGRVAVRFNTKFGKSLNNEIEVTGYGTIKYFERAARNSFRIFDRYGLGASLKYVNKSTIFDRVNSFTIGGDLFYQTGPVSEFNSLAGAKGDQLLNYLDETIGNSGVYILNNFEIYNKQLYFLMSGRYDNVYFDQMNRLLGAQNDSRRFEDFTPKFALNYKVTPSIAVYTSFGYSFDSPAGNELDNYPTSTKPGTLLNPDLKPQQSTNFELGVKGNLLNSTSDFFSNTLFEFTFFKTQVKDEIVPFDVYGSAFFRNSAKTNRNGIEAGITSEVYDGLKAIISYTYSDFSYDEYSTIAIAVDSVGTIITSSENYSGNIVPSVPKHNLFLALEYKRQLTPYLNGFVKGAFQSLSGMYVNDANSFETEGYQILNSTLGLEMFLGNFNVLLSGGVNNILDKTYVGFVNINSSNGRFYEAGEPQTFFASLKLGYQF